MRKFYIFFALLFSVTAFAQNWESNYDGPLLLAKESDRPLVLVFSGSDWCASCIKMDKKIWQSPYFTAYAPENYVLYRADFPRKTKNQLSDRHTLSNGERSEKCNANGLFPLVLILDAQKQVLGSTSYKKLSPEEYVTHLNSFLR